MTCSLCETARYCTWFVFLGRVLFVQEHFTSFVTTYSCRAPRNAKVKIGRCTRRSAGLHQNNFERENGVKGKQGSSSGGKACIHRQMAAVLHEKMLRRWVGIHGMADVDERKHDGPPVARFSDQDRATKAKRAGDGCEHAITTHYQLHHEALFYASRGLCDGASS